MEEVGSKGMGELKPRVWCAHYWGGRCGRRHQMMVGREELFPGGISSREKTLNGSRAGSVLIGSIGSRVGKKGGLPVG